MACRYGYAGHRNIFAVSSYFELCGSAAVFL